MFANAILLFFIIDPFGLIPVIAAILRHVPPERHRRIVARELLFGLVILLAFLFLGRHLLAVLHISHEALELAGGIILFLIALPMIFPTIRLSFEAEGGGEPIIVPIATPLIAGPSAIAMVLLMGSGDPSGWPTWIVSVLLAWLAAGAVILFGVEFIERLGKRALIAVERLMGMLLVAISVQLFLNGLRTYLDAAPA